MVTVTFVWGVAPQMMVRTGNEVANLYYEARLDPREKPTESTDARCALFRVPLSPLLFSLLPWHSIFMLCFPATYPLRGRDSEAFCVHGGWIRVIDWAMGVVVG